MTIAYDITTAIVAATMVGNEFAVAVFEHRPISTGSGLLILSAAVLWAAGIVFSITTLVPINNRIATLNPKHPYNNWLEDRSRWDLLHRIRVALLLVSVILLFIGLFQSPR